MCVVVAEAGVAPTHWGECEIRGPVHLFRERLLLRLFRRLLPAGKVLDAGCGSGSLALDLCRAGYAVEAVEDSAEFAALVGVKAQRFGVADRLRVQRASVTDLPFANGSFAGLLCGEVLEHVVPEAGGDQAAVREFHRVLQPGGICVASVPLNPRLWDHTDEWARHVKRYQRSEFVDLFASAGFVVERVRVWGFPLGRLYHRLLFAPWLARTAGQDLISREARADTRAGRSRILAEAVALFLRFDELFARFAWGRGIVLCARRVD
ncbi:MAG: methyltransferase domain-containing protein [Gemmatimonadetes bacterium]|nr:methyltransferase domain-containing protein [Gemmatimonadota bacterium]MBT7417235.1 methyltransferase domain-containing protein [Gemmatimonadota bacterium]